MCDSALSINRVKAVDQVFVEHLVKAVDQVFVEHLTKPEEEEKKEKGVSGDKFTYLDTLKELEASRKYICEFDTENSIIVICYANWEFKGKNVLFNW
jgi:hypothetical protein